MSLLFHPQELSYKDRDLVTLASELLEVRVPFPLNSLCVDSLTHISSLCLHGPLQDGEHYQGVASDGSMGMVHRSALLERPAIPPWPMPWFHGALSRLDAEKLLDRKLEGQFLLRTSQNTKGVYALALRQVGVWLQISCTLYLS